MTLGPPPREALGGINQKAQNAGWGEASPHFSHTFGYRGPLTRSPTAHNFPTNSMTALFILDD